MEDTLALVVALVLGITSALGVLKVRHKWMWISWFLALCLGAFTFGMLGRYPEWAQLTGTHSILWHHSIYIVNTFLFSGLFVLIFANWDQLTIKTDTLFAWDCDRSQAGYLTGPGVRPAS